MEPPFLDYDQIAAEYNQRYPSLQPTQRGRVLLDVARRIKAERILEVGSGTGVWLNMLRIVTDGLFGLDYSMGMIREARKQAAPLKLSRGSALHLPYRDDTFELIYCIDAIHHFGDQKGFVREAFRALKPGGALVVIGFDPHEGTTSWYIYDYFEGVYDTDLRRYPSGKSLFGWMKAEGFQNVSAQTAERILNVHVGKSVLKHPFLKHNSTSQLALLSQEAYQAGIDRIKVAVAEAKTRKERIAFRSNILVKAYVGYKPSEYNITGGMEKK